MNLAGMAIHLTVAINQEAMRWLRLAQADVDPSYPYLLSVGDGPEEGADVAGAPKRLTTGRRGPTDVSGEGAQVSLDERGQRGRREQPVGQSPIVAADIRGRGVAGGPSVGSRSDRSIG
jgi:hypothetical protein